MPRDSRILALRQQLAAEIVRSLGVDSQFVVGPSYGIRQPRMSERNRGIVDRCTVEWLIRRIHVLGGTVTLSVSSAMRGRRGCGSNSRGDARSEEHTSELQSLTNLVCRLLLEKKK